MGQVGVIREVLNNLGIEGSVPWLSVVLNNQRMGKNEQDLK